MRLRKSEREKEDILEGKGRLIRYQGEDEKVSQ